MSKKTSKGPGRYSSRNRKVHSRKQRRKWKKHHGEGAVVKKHTPFTDDFDIDAFMERMRRGEIV